MPSSHNARGAKVEPLEVGEVLSLIDAMPDRLRAIAVVGAGAGLRQGKALGLTVGAVDFLRRQLRVERQLVTLPGRSPYLAPPKTTSSVRTIPLPDFVTSALAAHVATHEPGADGLFFTTATGGPVPRNRFGETWRAAVSRSGARADATFHDLRHFTPPL